MHSLSLCNEVLQPAFITFVSDLMSLTESLLTHKHALNLSHSAVRIGANRLAVKPAHK